MIYENDTQINNKIYGYLHYDTHGVSNLEGYQESNETAAGVVLSEGDC